MDSNVFLVGNVASELTEIGSATSRGVKFRLVSTRRRLDRASDTWVDASEYWVEAVCWGRLVDGVLGSVRKGDPVVVSGHLESTSWESDGNRRYKDQLVVAGIGHDLTRGTSTFRKHPRSGGVIPGGDGFGTDGIGMPADADVDADSATDLGPATEAAGVLLAAGG